MSETSVIIATGKRKSAIARVRITQTAATGFAEGQVAFDHKPKAEKTAPTPALQRKAAEAARPVADEGLREALARLGEKPRTGGRP